MAGVRDPAFWKRFSVAVHLDEEKGPRNPQNPHPADSWLYRETSKTRSRRFICPIFWLAFFVLVPTVTAVMIWLAHEGYFNALKPSGSTPATQADPNSGVTGS